MLFIFFQGAQTAAYFHIAKWPGILSGEKLGKKETFSLHLSHEGTFDLVVGAFSHVWLFVTP